MTKEEIELIADRVADKVIERLKGSGMAGVYQDQKSVNVAFNGLNTLVTEPEVSAKKRWKELYDNGLIGGKNET